MTVIPSNSFKGCSSLTKITIPSSFKTICKNSFEGCSSLKEITIPSSVKTIESDSFKGCSSLTKITIPSSVTTICKNSFEGCSSLKEITIPSSVTTIESDSFKGCKNLEQIKINPQTKVNQSSFDNCESFNNLVISSSQLTRNEMNIHESSIFFGSNINSSFFNSIESDKQESILNLIKSMKRRTNKEKIANIQNLFAYLMSEKQQSKKYESSQKGACLQIVKNDEQILIKSEMTEILYENQKLEKNEFLKHINNFKCLFIEVKYPSSGYDAIYNKLVNMRKGNSKLKIAIFITGSDATNQFFHGNKDISYVTLDKCITKIKSDGRSGSFEDCSSLEEILIPSSVTQIGSDAFNSCKSLSQITIPSSVTQIGQFAFYDCSSLTQIAIPSSVTRIEQSAFSGCSLLIQITILSSVAQIEQFAFFNCSSLTQITIPSSLNIKNTGIRSNVKLIRV